MGVELLDIFTQLNQLERTQLYHNTQFGTYFVIIKLRKRTENVGGDLLSKHLSEMTLAELWELFPIQLTEHQPCWKGWYQIEKNHLQSILLDTVRIHHIGSTAINGIWAKPIIDILVEANLHDFETIKSQILRNDYLCMKQTGARIDFNKGYTPNGFSKKVFHLHLRKFGDNDELYFRDYLNEHSETAKVYEKLKMALWQQFRHNRDRYTERKTVFVHKYTQEAIIQYGEIYR